MYGARLAWGFGLVAILNGCIVKSGGDEEPSQSGGTGGSQASAGGAGGAESGFTSQRPGGLGFGAEAAPRTPEWTEGHTDDPTRASLRALQEADVVQVLGKRLYAISSVSGLSIIDIAQRDQLSLLGRYTSSAKPFEMYVRSAGAGKTVVLALMGAQYGYDTENGRSTYTSQVLALDVTDPAKIAVVGTFDLPGAISDSRAVGNVLYVVSYENKYDYQNEDECYGCSSIPSTTVVSLDITDPTKITEVDRETFEEKKLANGWTRRSVMVNDPENADERKLYLAGASSVEQSVIHTVDIADPAGKLSLGPSVKVDGVINSRWQMDEHNSVLRVISQPADVTESPSVQTFSIEADSFVPLGSLAIELPRPEQLRTVRFDGTRAYAVTFERTDPLFTIDLTDPAKPTQEGELEMPGFLYHIEPRADRLLALGIDAGNEDGGLFVSMINVEKLGSPTEIERINFGQRYSNVSEEQDRVHKLFNILDIPDAKSGATGLILVPYAGYSDSYTRYTSGIQLINVTQTAEKDDLEKMGLVPAVGIARRAFVYDERLFGVSEEQVQTFDIANRAAPAEKARLFLTQRVHRTVPVGTDKVLRVRSDYWTHVAMADLTSVEGVTSTESKGFLDLSKELTGETSGSSYYDDSPIRTAPAFTFGQHVVLAVVTKTEDKGETTLLVVDTSGDVPSLATKLQLDYAPIDVELGETIAQVGSSLVIQRPGTKQDGEETSSVLDVIDFSNPTQPKVIASPERPVAWGNTGLFVTGTTLSSGYYNLVGEDDVKYFLDRVSLAKAAAPVAQTPVNIPGLLVAPTSSGYLSAEFWWVESPELSGWECSSAGGVFDDEQVCWTLERKLSLLTLEGDQVTASTPIDIEPTLQIGNVVLAEDRVFLIGRDASTWSGRVLVVGEDSGKLSSQMLSVSGTPSSPRVIGKKLYALTGSELIEVDATNVANASVKSIEYIYTYGAGNSAGHLAISGKHALVSKGDAGVTSIDLE
jgi:hypothetical protein